MWKSEIIKDNTKLKAIAEMTERYYGPENDISNVNYLEHEYFKNPEGDALMNIAWSEENSEVAGQYAAIPMRVKVGDRERKALMSVNTLTDDKYRGQGIFKILATEVYDRAEKEGFELVYGMPNQNSYPGFLKYIGFSDLGAVPLFLRPLVPSNMVKHYLKNKVLETLAHPFNPMFRIKEKNADIETVPFTDNAEKYADVFWESIKDKYPVMISRNYEYIKYRFIDIPRRDYCGFYAVAGGKPVAYAIGRVMEVAGISCAMIADFLFLEGYEKEAITALKRLMLQLKDEGADMAGCMVTPASSEAKLLKKAGFFKCPKSMEPQPFRFIYRQLSKDDASLKLSGDLKNWFFTMGDYDVV